MPLRDRLTLITPVRITQPAHLEFFHETLRSYHEIFGDDKPQHLVAAANDPAFHPSFTALMDRYNTGGWANVSPGTKPIPALTDLVRSVRTPYVHIVLADVRAVGKKNFLALGCDAMDQDPLLMQMRYGDEPLSCARPFNFSPFELENGGERVYFRGMPEFPFDPLAVGQDTVWRFPMAAAAQKRFIGLALWPCTYRTSVLQRVAEEAAKRLHTQQAQWAGTLAGWMSIVNRTADFGGWCLPEKGWPEGFAFLEGLRQGTLNMACYMYALGREQKTWDDFLATSTIEVYHRQAS